MKKIKRVIPILKWINLAEMYHVYLFKVYILVCLCES